MAKQISISDEVYEELSKRKNEQSFSEIIKTMMKEGIKTSGQEFIELCQNRKSFDSEEDVQKFLDDMDKSWESSSKSRFDRIKKAWGGN